jgi:hypothetical protein
MAVLTRRTRIVNFRLSEGEYDYLKSLCLSRGARSISDYARATICQEIQAQTSDPDARMGATVQRLDGKVEELERELKRLKDLIMTMRDLSRGRTSAAEVG